MDFWPSKESLPEVQPCELNKAPNTIEAVVLHVVLLKPIVYDVYKRTSKAYNEVDEYEC